MEKTIVLVLIICFLLVMPVYLTTPSAKGESWKQTSTSDFEDGEAFFVNIDGGTLKLARTLMQEWTAMGESTSDRFGYSVASAGDVNGDGYDDVVVGAYNNDGAGSDAGEAYVYHGSSSGLSATPDWSDLGEAADDRFGYSVAPAGDVNGDGYDDVIVGAHRNDGAGSDAGEAYVYHGSSSGLSATPDWSDQGEADSDEFGGNVASAGDVNGDGYDDVIVGAYGNDGGGTNAGKAYVYYWQHGYIKHGVYESQVFDIDETEGVDWCKFSWAPVQQPAGTGVKVQIATSDDGVTWNWRGPDGTSSSFYTSAAGQPIYSGDRGKALRVRFYLESDFGEAGDAFGNKKTARTPSITDFSVTYLKFTKPTLTLTWPNGGENLMHGESYPITWTASGDMKNSTPVALSYSLDGGNSWTAISSATANDGHYRWTLPSNENVQRAMVKIVVTALDSSTVEDTSDGSFSIDPPPGNPDTMDKVLSPNSGDEVTAGDVVRLEWRLSGEDSVSLFYSTDFGQSWNLIIEDFNADTSYNWKMPDDLTSENVLVKVKGENTEVTSGIFMIGEETDEENERTDVGDSDENDPTHAVTGGLTALILGLLVALVVVVRYRPKEDKKK